MISQTSGTTTSARLASCRRRWCASPSGRALRLQLFADGVPAVLVGVREQLMQGASQIKLAVGGGVSSNYDRSTSPNTASRRSRRRSCREDWAPTWRCTLHIARDPPRHRGRRQVHRARPVARRTDDQADGREGVWLSTQPFLSTRTRSHGARSDNERKYKQWRRHRQRLPAGQEVRCEDRVRHRHPVQPDRRGAPGLLLPKIVKWFTPPRR